MNFQWIYIDNIDIPIQLIEQLQYLGKQKLNVTLSKTLLTLPKQTKSKTKKTLVCQQDFSGGQVNRNGLTAKIQGT